jgi:hypothetical protein
MNAIESALVAVVLPVIRPALLAEVATLQPKFAAALAKTNLDAATQAQVVTAVLAVVNAEIAAL